MKENKVVNLSKEVNVKGIGDHTNGNCISVLCITTGKVYTSLIDASEAEGCSYSALSACLRGKIKTCHGKQFCYAHKQIEKSEEVLNRLRKFAEMEADAKAFRKIKEEEERKKKEIEDLKNKLQVSEKNLTKIQCQLSDMEEKVSVTKEKLADERDYYNLLRFSLKEKCAEYGYKEF